VPIGETLAQARHEAGLTLAQVSQQTRIRETIIRKIEEDDYSECGGDFYARGHIRAIAKVVGADPEPLIQEYDTRHRAPGALGTVSLDELLATSAHGAHRHRPGRPAARARVTPPGPPAWRPVSLGAPGTRAAPRYPARRRTVYWTVFVSLALAVVALGFVALRLLAGGSRPTAPSAAGPSAATSHHAGHGRPSPAAKASHPAAAAPSATPRASPSQAPSPAPAQSAQSLAPVRATAFGPNGGDNPQLAHLVIAGRPAAGWHSDWYTSARFGNLYPGTGVLLNMGRTVAITGARINLGHASGASLQLRVGGKPALAYLPAVAHASRARGMVRFHLSHPARGRFVLVWFTRLPADRSGSFQAHVHSVSQQGPR
jgi:transcriptional regulator with XRE-family HTH domain